ncbi:MAG: DUF1080 domain-containing protein [Bacteroidaceae bacterium]|nr:DUF1080 domain-containing protein [Bacteroidaceae bacterium]
MLASGMLLLFLLACGHSSKTVMLNEWKNNGTMFRGDTLEVSAGDSWMGKRCRNFILTGQVMSEQDAFASLLFHSDGQSGYEVLFHNGPIDGTLKTGSLSAVRNLYRSLATDGEWSDFEVAVRGKNISVKINDVDVVCYTEPTNPYRSPDFSKRLLGEGNLFIKGQKGKTLFRDMKLTTLQDDAVNENDTLPTIDEQSDAVIHLQQQFFPVIDYHVHLKGGLTKEMAHAMSMNYGINYGVAPNAGEGGVGRMLANDEEVYDYFKEVKPLPFLCGVQGEGRRWSTQFSSEALAIFDYLFTDAMTIVDHKRRIARIYRPEEVQLDGLTPQQYMDVIVDQTVKILDNEPADIYANATYIPDDWLTDYDSFWTSERMDKVLDVLEKHDIAVEISARYKIPNETFIRKAKARGLKFTFGTNNVDSDFGRLEYCTDMVKKCGLTVDDMWFPSMSHRSQREVIDYNGFLTPNAPKKITVK